MLTIPVQFTLKIRKCGTEGNDMPTFNFRQICQIEVCDPRLEAFEALMTNKASLNDIDGLRYNATKYVKLLDAITDSKLFGAENTERRRLLKHSVIAGLAIFATMFTGNWLFQVLAALVAAVIAMMIVIASKRSTAISAYIGARHAGTAERVEQLCKVYLHEQ